MSKNFLLFIVKNSISDCKLYYIQEYIEKHWFFGLLWVAIFFFSYGCVKEVKVKKHKSQQHFHGREH